MQKEDVLSEIDRMSWERSAEENRVAIDRLVTIDDAHIDLLILPRKGKSTFENAAIVLAKIGFPRLNRHVTQLLEWLKDLNWLGANRILDLLVKADSETLVPCLRDAIDRAIAEKDEMWLGGLKVLITKKELGIAELGTQREQALAQVNWY
jgi:hypothetical protein